MNMIRIAVVGCGNISARHFSAIEQLENSELTAVCDIQQDRAEKRAAQFGVRAYTDFYQMLSDGVCDAVHLCTPHYLHTDQSIAALQAGCHVFCEKPMAIRYKDALDVLAAAEKSGRQYGVCFQNRYNESSVCIKELLREGKLGKILGARAVVPWDRDEAYYLADSWRGKIATEGGGVVINQAIHTLDLLRWFMDSPVVDVKANISTKRLADVVETEDTADALITFANGARAVFFATLCQAGNDPIEMVIHCEKGKIELGEQLKVSIQGEEVQTRKIARPSGQKSYWGSCHQAIIHDFYESIKENRPFAVGASEALPTAELTDWIYRAAGRKFNSAL